MTEETNTIILELPKTFDVQGARKLSGSLDLEKWDNDLFIHAIRQAIKLWSRNASAGVDGFEAKVKAETDAFNKCLDGTYNTKPDTIVRDAEISLLTDLFLDQGIPQTEATKRAKKKDARFDFIRLKLSRDLNRSDISEAEVTEELNEQTELLDSWHAEYVAEERAKIEREALLKARLRFKAR